MNVSVCRLSIFVLAAIAFKVVFLFSCLTVLGADDLDGRPRVRIEHFAAGERVDRLEHLLARAAETELQRNDLTPQRPDAPDQLNEPLPDDELVERAENFEGELYLAAIYRVSGQRLSVGYRLIDIDKREILAEAESEGELDLLLDRMVSRLIDRVVNDSASRIAELREARQRIAELEGRQTELQESEPAGAASTDERSGQPSTATRSSRNMELSTAGTGIVSIGEFAPYLPSGFSAESNLLVWLSNSDTRLGLGLGAGYQRMIPKEEGFGEYVSSFVPTGVSMHLSSAHSNVVSLRMIATAGAAIRIHDGSSVSERLAAAIPFASVGAGPSFALGERLGAGLQVALRSLFHVYRDEQDSDPRVEPIMAVAPGFRLFYRL